MKKILASYTPDGLRSHQKNIYGPLTIILIAIIMLIVEYYGWQGPYFRHFKAPHIKGNEAILNAQIYTSTSFAILFFLIPLVFNFFFPLDNDRSVGLKFPSHLKQTFFLYSPLVIIMLPILFFICKLPSFHKFYPLYRPENIKMFFIYELIYLTQFVSIEFFFRGFGPFRLEKICPGYGVILMVIPYSFVHIHKPFLEAFASIIAGLILGQLALKSKSIWPGVVVHACIAFSVDFFSIFHSGLLSL